MSAETTSSVDSSVFDACDAAISVAENALAPFLSVPLSRVVATLTPIDSARLHASMGSCVVALAAAYMRVGGSEPGAGGVAAEFAAQRALSARVESAAAAAAGPPAGSRVDAAAAQRFGSAAIGQGHKMRDQSEGGAGPASAAAASAATAEGDSAEPWKKVKGGKGGGQKKQRR